VTPGGLPWVYGARGLVKKPQKNLKKKRGEKRLEKIVAGGARDVAGGQSKKRGVLRTQVA